MNRKNEFGSERGGKDKRLVKVCNISVVEVKGNFLMEKSFERGNVGEEEIWREERVESG